MEVSIIVGCMNRVEHLIKSIPSWLAHPVKEIIIVDWNSRVSVLDELSYLEDSRIKVFTIKGVATWILSLALNFAAHKATHPTLLKLDCDTILHPEFFKAHPPGSLFYSGNWKLARNPNETHLNGILMVPRETFFSVGGYNEYIRTYGWDDTDLYARLEKVLPRKDIQPLYVRHLPHENSTRSEASDLGLEICKNMYISELTAWKGDFTRYVKLDHYYPMNLEKNVPPSSLVSQAHYSALRAQLNKHGYPWAYTTNKPLKFLTELYHYRNKDKFFIEPKNGLGNRLRALASAAVIAAHLGKILVVVWIPDIHCQARFDELFDDEGIVHTDQEVDFLKDRTPDFQCNHSFSSESHSFSSPCYHQHQGDIYIASACVIKHTATDWTLESKWLQNHLRLLPEINKSILEYEGLIQTCVGIHIRMGQEASKHSYEDSSTWDKENQKLLAQNRSYSHYKHFVAEMKRLWSRDPQERFFICADNEEVYHYLESRYPERIGKTLFWINKNTYDRSREQLYGALVDVYLLSKTKYLLGSPWSSFTELATRLGAKKLLISGKDFGIVKYGLLYYPSSYNLGDEIQSFAARRFLPRVDYYINRDDQRYHHSEGKLDDLNLWKLVVIENGWFDGRLANFPFHRKISPLFISFHLNESEGLFDTPTYSFLKSTASLECSMLNHVNYFRKHAPIGCRDERTLSLLQDKGIEAYHSSCLTLTLSKKEFASPVLTEEAVYIVDLDPSLLHLVPPHIQEKAIRLTHATPRLLPLQEKIAQARELLGRYCGAKMVITGRLHCALPCLAFGTPVLFLFPEFDSDPRFGETFRALLGSGTRVPSDWDWEAPVLSPGRRLLVKQLRSSLKKLVKSSLRQQI